MSTLSDYLLINNHLANFQKQVAADPVVASATKYYQQHITSVKTPKDLVSNYRLFSYALAAFGLGDKVHQKALFEKVLEQGADSPSDLARRLNDSRILAFAKTFDFNTYGSATTVTSGVESDVVARYKEQQLETNEGKLNPGVELALYFKNNAPNLTSIYGILADKHILTVVETALGISKYIANEPVDTQAKLLANKINIADFKDPKKLNNFIQRFAANYDLQNGGTTTQSSNPVVSLYGGGDTSTTADNILSLIHGG